MMVKNELEINATCFNKDLFKRKTLFIKNFERFLFHYYEIN